MADRLRLTHYTQFSELFQTENEITTLQNTSESIKLQER